MLAPDSQEALYAHKLDEERRYFDGLDEFDDLPPIYHYWSHTFVRPMLEPLGCSHPREFLARYLHESAQRCAAERPVFLSIGSGDANNEIEIARQLLGAGRTDFAIECVEMNPALVERASAAVAQAGMGAHVTFVRQDFNTWQPARAYHGVMANQSLHHVSDLEHLFDAVRAALAPQALFATSDIIGRNGHQRWPEARRLVERFWEELPPPYRFHRKLQRLEETFADWDCSSEGFEGIRAQDVLPLLLERFHFHVFIGFGNVVDPFVDRGFGPNFDASGQWDRAFIDRVHACDERALTEGFVTPTHMMAVLATQPSDAPHYARGLSPEASVRRRDLAVSASDMARADGELAQYFHPPEHWLPLRGLVRQAGEVHGWSEDDWSGESLEFTVVPQRAIERVRVNVTMPDALPPGSQLRLEAGDSSAIATPTSRYASVECAVHLAEGAETTVRISTSATVNHRQLGLSADQRELGFHLDAVLFD